MKNEEFVDGIYAEGVLTEGVLSPITTSVTG